MQSTSDPFDRFADWLAGCWRNFGESARGAVLDPVFSVWDFWLGLMVVLVLIGPRSDLVVVPVIAVWAFGRLGAKASKAGVERKRRANLRQPNGERCICGLGPKWAHVCGTIPESRA